MTDRTHPADYVGPDPGPLDYRVFATIAYDAADNVRHAHPGGVTALDSVGWESERVAEELEELSR